MSTTPTSYESVNEFEIISKSMTAQASLEFPKISVMHDGEENRKIDLLAHIFFPKALSLTFEQELSRLDKSFNYAQEPVAPSVKPSKLSRLVIISAGSTPTISFMYPVQSDTLIFHPSANELEMQDTSFAKPRKPIHEPSYDHLPSISELCEESSPDETAQACDPIGYTSTPHNTPAIHSMKPAGKLVREKTFVNLEDALDEDSVEPDELGCDPESYRSPNTPSLKPAGKLVREKAFVNLEDALQDDASEINHPMPIDSSDLRDAPSELIFRMSDDDEKPLRTVSPYQLKKS